jgi:hypothetical protein
MSGVGQGLPFRLRCQYVGSTLDKVTTLLHSPSRQPWAKRVNHCTAAIFAPARGGRDMRFFARPAHLRIFRAATGVNPGSLSRSTAGAADCLLPKVRAASDGAIPWPIGMASGSIAIYTKYGIHAAWPTPIRPYFRPSGSTE